MDRTLPRISGPDKNAGPTAPPRGKRMINALRRVERHGNASEERREFEHSLAPFHFCADAAWQLCRLPVPNAAAPRGLRRCRSPRAPSRVHTRQRPFLPPRLLFFCILGFCSPPPRRPSSPPSSPYVRLRATSTSRASCRRGGGRGRTGKATLARSEYRCDDRINGPYELPYFAAFHRDLDVLAARPSIHGLSYFLVTMLLPSYITCAFLFKYSSCFLIFRLVIHSKKASRA
jgi:hypothetical protein